MKTMLQHTCNINRPPALLRARRFRFHSVLFRFALAVLLLLGAAGGGFSQATAGSFPTAATDEGAPGVQPGVSSFGLFKILVRQQYWGMMDGSAGPIGNNSQYYGYLASTHRFTSPLLSDYNTWIGLSKAHCLNTADPALYNPAPGVSCSATAPFNAGGLTPATASYSEDLTGILTMPPGFPTAGNYNEVFTYMLNMQLTAYSNCVYSGSSMGLPILPYDTFNPMVYTGPQHYPSIHKSIGRMVSNLPNCGPSLTDYAVGSPAHSFFDIYINAWIPPNPGSMAGTDVPATGFYLYNDPNDMFFGPQPLIVENTAVEDLPAPAIYYHGGALYGVPVKFLNAGSDRSGTITWNAGDTFGILMLAGHELNLVCGQGPYVDKFVENVLGKPGQANPEPPVLWTFPTNSFPSPGVTYSSQPGAYPGGGSVDEIYFTNTAYGTIYIRSLMHGNLVNPITPPAPNILATYTDASSSLSCEVSDDHVNYYGVSGSGPMKLSITNVGTSGNATVYNTAIVSMTNVVSLNGAGFGPFLLRQSFTKSSTGRHVLMKTAAGSYVASYLDATYQYSNDGATWYDANRPIRLSIAEPTCGVAGQGVYIQQTNKLEKLSWSNSNYRLQGSTNLSKPFWVNVSSTSPVTLGATNGLHFFRLVCP
jgi:hypothetical protein